jgi:hypothetical protein
LINTNAPVNTTGNGTSSEGSGSTGTLVNTNAPVQAQMPTSHTTSSGSTLVNTNAPVATGRSIG